eukprot:gene7186-9799_t
MSYNITNEYRSNSELEKPAVVDQNKFGREQLDELVMPSDEENNIEVPIFDWITLKGKSLVYSKNMSFDCFRGLVLENFLLSDFNFKLYELQPNDTINKIELCESNFHEIITKIGELVARNEAPSTIYLWKDISPDHLPSINYGGVEHDACDNKSNYSTITGDSDSQAWIRLPVLERDESKCVFCEEDGHNRKLIAAHIFEHHSSGGSVNFLDYEILGEYVVENFLTLCERCHEYYDWHMITINPMTEFIEMPDAFLSCSPFKNEYLKMRDTIVRKPTHPVRLKYWPPKKLLEYRYAIYVEQNDKRRKDHSLYEFHCFDCHMRFKVETWFQKHQCKKKDSISSHSNVNMYHTPLTIEKNVVTQLENTKLSGNNMAEMYHTNDLENEDFIEDEYYKTFTTT